MRHEGRAVAERDTGRAHRPPPGPAGGGGGRTRLRRIGYPTLRLIVFLAIGAAIATTTARRWAEVHGTMARLAWPSVLLALVVAVAGMVAGMLAWRAALTDLGHRIPVRAAGRISLVGQLGKYLPGSVWAYVLQMELGRRAGVPRARALLASVVSVALGVAAGLTLGVAGLPALLHAARGPDGAAGRVAVYLLVAVTPFALVCAHPRVLTALVGRTLRLLRREPLPHPLSWRGVLATVGWTAVAYALFGVHLWLLANALGAPGPAAVARSIGAMALAMTISVFAVVVPSGFGVREFILVAALTPYLGSSGVALGVALSSRLLFIAADLLAAGGAALSGIRQTRSRTVAVPAVTPASPAQPDPAAADAQPGNRTTSTLPG